MSKNNPFNLPPPWNAGYALPQNVDDEGLERHAYTTSWAPRGSFDDPKVGTAGYAVPGYVREEGYGVGAMTTRWAPRGTYYGPRIKHWLDRPAARVVGRKPLPGGATQLQIQTLAGIETANTGGMAPFTAYGQRAARALLDTVAAMPESMRQPQLRAALNAIDPKLWSRAEAAANKELKAGVPARVALERGLAAAMTMGIGMELVELGKGKAPATRSQLGLVCYGRSAMGAVDPGLTTLLMASNVNAQLLAPPPREGYTWVPATATVPAHWERIVAPGVTRIDPSSPEEIAWQAAAEAARLKSLAERDRSTVLDQAPPVLEVGPFLLPLAGKSVGIHTTLTPEQKKFVDDSMYTTYKSATDGASGFGMAVLTLGRSGHLVREQLEKGIMPFAKFARPANAGDPYAGKMFGLYHNIDASTGKSYVQYKLYVPADSFFETVWKNIQTVRAAIHSFVKDALDAVTGAACKLVSSPAGKIGAGAVGAYYGGPQGAAMGVKGAEMAADSAACKDLPPCQPGLFQDPVTKICNLPPLPKPTNLTPILLLGGAAVAAYLFLGMKKS